MKKFIGAILLLIIVVVSFWAGGRFSLGTSSGPDDQGQRKILYYVDPMTPGFRSDSPGIAPCGMPLEPVYADADDDINSASMSMSLGAVKVSPERQQLIGVKVATVETQPLTYGLRLYGKVVPDETRVFRVNASTDSWIRSLSDVTTGSFVNKGQILAEALAPAYYNAQVTYLITLDNIDRIQQQLGGETRHQQGDLANNQIRVAVQALQNLGITDAQVEELANTREARPYLQVRAPTKGFVLNRNVTLNQWFKAAEEFYTIADLSKVWIYADVYENEARYLQPGMTVKVKHTQFGKTFDAKVSKVLPLFDAVSKTLKVRLDVDNPQYDLRPDMFVDVEIPINMPPAMYVSADAVIDSGMKTTVYVAIGDGVLEPREVETGWKLGRWVEITSGLMPGDNIVVSGNFLIDSESRMKTAASGMTVKLTKDLVCGMNVSEQAATESGRFVEHAGRIYYFCSPACKVKFLTDLKTFVGSVDSETKSQNLETISNLILDPVCGMAVDELKSEYSGWFFKLDEETYHFCSQQCMGHFMKNPGKYTGQKRSAKKSPADTDQPQKAQPDPTVSATPKQVTQKSDHGDADQHKMTKDAVVEKSHTTPGVIDWNGPESEQNSSKPKDWSGWGNFPGAKYLGQKQKKDAKKPSRVSDTLDSNREPHDMEGRQGND